MVLARQIGGFGCKMESGPLSSKALGEHRRLVSMNITKPRIAVDLDDVLFDFVGEFFAWHNQLYGTKLDPSRTVFDTLWEAWGGTQDEAAERVPRFFEETDMHLVEPIDGAGQTLALLRESWALSIVSARHPSTEEATRDWLSTYFSAAFDSVILGIGNPTSDGSVLTKAEVCAGIGASVLIEDQLLHALGAAEAGIPVLLFGERTWNQAVDLPSNVRRAEDWAHVQRILLDEDWLSKLA
jgi:uncharacterized HAD superfamily protein